MKPYFNVLSFEGFEAQQLARRVLVHTNSLQSLPYSGQALAFTSRAKRILERLGIQTPSAFVKILKPISYSFILLGFFYVEK